MTEKYSYWLDPQDEEMVHSFIEHIRQTALYTERVTCNPELTRSWAARIPVDQCTSEVDRCNTDPAFVFDCISRLGANSVGPVGHFFSAAPDLMTGLQMLCGLVHHLDDRMIAALVPAEDKTRFVMFYNKPMRASFYHAMAGALFLFIVDTWPAHIIDNSTFNFPRVSPRDTYQLKQTLGLFPWVNIEIGKWHTMSWSIKTEKLHIPSPTFVPEWWAHCQQFMKWGLDAQQKAAPHRKPWSRFLTGCMMTDLRGLNAKTAAKVAGVTEKTLHLKLKAEGYKSADIKRWIMEEVSQRISVAPGLDETYAQTAFGYSDIDVYRQAIKRLDIENPWHAAPQVRQQWAERWALGILD